jgi:hypothetical protein
MVMAKATLRITNKLTNLLLNDFNDGIDGIWGDVSCGFHLHT